MAILSVVSAQALELEDAPDVKSVSRNVVAASASDIIQEEILNLPANAEMTHVRQ